MLIGHQSIAIGSAPPLTGPLPLNVTPSPDLFQYELNSVPSNHEYNQSNPFVSAFYHPASTSTSSPPPLPPVYEMNRSPHGTCVIISNCHFAQHTARKGSLIDLHKLLSLFESLGYNVEQKEDLNSKDMKEYLCQVANREEHNDADSFVCCILSHGDKDNIFGSDSQQVDLNDLVTPFKGSRCRKLAGKPKMFFIQSCRGDIDDEMVEVFESDGPHKQPAQQLHTIPSEADFFFGFATTRGCSAYRSTKNGSWYIMNLYDVMMEYAQHGYDLLTMHTIVNQRVSEMVADNQPNLKQCSAPVSTLRKRVIFK